MDVKEAVAKAKAFAANAFEDEGVGQVRLEEIDRDEHERDWLITLGIYRPAINARSSQIASILGNPEMKRAYRVFRVSDETGDVKSIKIREFSEE